MKPNEGPVLSFPLAPKRSSLAKPRGYRLRDLLDDLPPLKGAGIRARIRHALRQLLRDETGAYTLVEARKYAPTQLIAGIIETFILESVVLDEMEMFEIAGNAFTYNEELTLPGVEFRAVNAAYAESTGTINPRTESLVILGGDSDVDRFLAKTNPANAIGDLRAGSLNAKIKAAVIKFQDAFINGDVAVDANSFDGLKKRLTGAQVIDPGGNGIPVVGASDADRQAFLDQVDALLAAVPNADALYMNDLIKGKFKSAARRIGGWDQERDDFGRKIEFYDGVRIRDIGNKGDGTRIIPQTETQGASSVASSIYAVRWGESPEAGGTMGLTNGGVDGYDLGEIDAKPAFRVRVEFYCGLGLFGGKAAGRLKGILNS